METQVLSRKPRSNEHSDCGISLLDGLLVHRPSGRALLAEPGPGTVEARKIVSAALSVADDSDPCRLRYIFVPGQRREKLGEILTQAKKRQRIGANGSDRPCDKSCTSEVPALIAVVARCDYDHPDISIREQHLTVGAAIQNMRLCAQALGYAAHFIGGRDMLDMHLARSLELDSDEQLFGFVSVGTPAAKRQGGRRPGVRAHFSVWTPDS